MIGVASKKAGSAIQLLGEHRASEQMRPGRATEGQQEIGAGSRCIIMTVRGTDQEPRFAHPAVAPRGEPFRKMFRRQIAAPLI